MKIVLLTIFLVMSGKVSADGGGHVVTPGAQVDLLVDGEYVSGIAVTDERFDDLAARIGYDATVSIGGYDLTIRPEAFDSFGSTNQVTLIRALDAQGNTWHTVSESSLMHHFYLDADSIWDGEVDFDSIQQYIFDPASF